MHKSVVPSVVLATALLVSNSTTAGTFVEEFSSDPAGRQWSSSGDATLFAWNSTNQNLEVTWDSSRPNSYFHLPLGRTLTTSDDFNLSFELRLSDAVAGIDPQKPNPFQLAVGFINLAQATSSGFVRGSGYESPNLVEFDYFPDPGGAWMWGPSLTAPMIDWTGTNWSTGGFASLDLTPNDLFHITMVYTAADRTLRTSITKNGMPFGPMDDSTLSSQFLGFHVDRVAICSYGDAGQPFFPGSILAHGTIDNLAVTTVSLVEEFRGQLEDGVWVGRCLTHTNYIYTLQRTENLETWTAVSDLLTGTGSEIVLQDPSPPPARAFYRVSAHR